MAYFPDNRLGIATQQPTNTFGGSSLFGGGATQTSQASTGFGAVQPSTFGGGTSLFGNTQTSQPSIGFGTAQPQQQQQQQSTFGGGSLFGAGTTQTSQASTGFGTAQPSTFGGGTSLFGNTQTSQPSIGFGTTQQTSTFGGGTSLFGGGTTQTTQQSTGFGAAQPSTFGGGTGLFGNTQTSQPSIGFGTTQQTSTFGGTSLFGGGAQTSQPSTGFGGFGGGSGGLFSQSKPTGFSFPQFGQSQQQTQPLFGQPQQQQQQVQPVQIDEQAAFQQSIFTCYKFGDERDCILANLNYIQACWGSGRGYYNQSSPPVIYNDKNILYRFKAVGYSFLFNDSNEDGQVVIHIKKAHKKVCDEETQFINTLQSMFNKPNIFFKITGSKAVNEEMTVIVLIAEDRISLRRILATELSSALMQPQMKMQLDNLGIVSIEPKVKPSPEQLKSYLDSPPAGLDPRVWKKAQEDNPDPTNMIPIPFLGPESLKARVDAQKKENTQHYERLKLIAEEVSNLHNRHANMTAELNQLKRQYAGISHRTIMAVVRLLIIQRNGLPYQPEEANLKRQMEELSKQLNSPTHYRGRLNELMSHVRMHKATLEGKGPIKYSVDSPTLEQAKDFLMLEQNSIKHLVSSVKACLEYVQRMNEDMEECSRKNHPS